FDGALWRPTGVGILQRVLLPFRGALVRRTTNFSVSTTGEEHWDTIVWLDHRAVAEAEECTALQEEIARVLNDNGEILDNASPRLAIIRRDLKISYDKLMTRLNRIITNSN
ncbi:MAG: hypothetical protein CUN53_21465, partial [Phototrophicales bacterium]